MKNHIPSHAGLATSTRRDLMAPRTTTAPSQLGGYARACCWDPCIQIAARSEQGTRHAARAVGALSATALSPTTPRIHPRIPPPRLRARSSNALLRNVEHRPRSGNTRRADHLPYTRQTRHAHSFGGAWRRGETLSSGIQRVLGVFLCTCYSLQVWGSTEY